MLNSASVNFGYGKLVFSDILYLHMIQVKFQLLSIGNHRRMCLKSEFFRTCWILSEVCKRIFNDSFSNGSFVVKRCEILVSFDRLKALLTKAPVLVQPKSGKNFVIYSDASLNGLLKPHERNYSIHDLELATIRWWLELLKDYDLVIDYHPGKANVVEDALSRKSLFALRAMNSRLILFDVVSYKQNRCESTSDSEFQVGTDGCFLFRGRICVPKNLKLVQKILNKPHNGNMSIHPGKVKVEHQLSSGLLQPVMIPEWKWERITMEFISGLPLSPKKKDVIWVIDDQLTKSAHFISVRMDFFLDRLAELYVSEIVRLHEVPISIIPDRDPRFISRFWSKLQEALGTQLHFNTAFHPQTDGQSEQVIKILEDMFRCCVLEFEGNWEKYMPLVEFVYNNSYQSRIKMALYEALYGRKCKTPLYWIELSQKKLHRVDLFREIEEKVKVIRDSLKATSDHQKSYSDLKRKEIEFQISDKVFLKVSLWKKLLWFGRKGKLSSRTGLVAYRLALPPELDQIHNVFHVSLFRRYRSNPSHVNSPSKVEIQPDMTYSEEPIKILVALVKVLWQQHGIEEATWEPEDTMRKQYPNLFTGKIFEDENS
ncbi:reverse transcriptase [Gossypium australe]|uniref:Reverse transcriptase n=1 Tax=Gossypium australe TaxID=47621 RepID=A0A5B6W8M4_9ROSI|nr:reverse transcriptase [Gossypium australe]